MSYPDRNDVLGYPRLAMVRIAQPPPIVPRMSCTPRWSETASVPLGDAIHRDAVDPLDLWRNHRIFLAENRHFSGLSIDSQIPSC